MLWTTRSGPPALNCRISVGLLSLKCCPVSGFIRHDVAATGSNMMEVKRKRRTNSVTFDVDELEARRRRAGFTQKVLAAKAHIDPRTLQRALAGQPVRMDVGQGIVRALGAPLQSLLRQDEEGPNTLLLWRCTDADAFLDVVDLTDRFRFKISVSPTQVMQDTLQEVVEFFENESDGAGPIDLHFMRDMEPREWIKVAVELNKIIDALEQHGLALYAGHYESTDFYTYGFVVVARDSGTRRLEHIRDKTTFEENEARREAQTR
jgi:hypothetical protein